MSTVIKIENLWKEYRLGVISHGTLTHDLQSWWARVRGKDDPNSKIPIAKSQVKQKEGDHFWALQNINLKVNQGEVLGIIGKNGAGKSTLLKILSRVTAPTRGNIKVRGRIASLLEVGTGFHPELTGRENIFLNGAILGMAKQEIRSKLDEIVNFSGVEDFIDTPVKRFSSGMYVRLAFSVAAHLEPEILVVDEVLAVGDLEFQKKCLGKMKDVSREGRTVLFVSHNMGAIRRLCTKGCLLLEGAISMTDSADSVVDSYLESSLRNLNDEGYVEWKIGRGPGGDEIRIVSCAVKGGITNRFGAVTTEEEVIVECVYEQRVNLSAMRIVVRILTSNGDVAFASTDHSIREERIYPKGLYRSTCHIPPLLLNSGIYQIQIRAGIPGRLELVPDTDVCRFIVEGNTFHGSNYDLNWPGSVCPRLEWNIVEVN